AAKSEEGLLERRVRMLRDRLRRAVIVDESERSSETVGVGSSVEIEDEQGERMEVEISSVGGVSPDSPVGQALMGRKVGDEVTIEAPRGVWRGRPHTAGGNPRKAAEGETRGGRRHAPHPPPERAPQRP